MKTNYVYMMTNKYHNVLFIGVTSDLVKRVYEHKMKVHEGFTKKYNCQKLVWFQQTNDIATAITFEKRMKKWKREFKENVTREMNSEWKDLYDDLI